DPDVPLADVPETGDSSLTWYAMAFLSATALAVASLLKKKDNED
ncbi:MAG: LPXTG cell wall anchor domain-containing protein, partial [Lawsonibacter sp.]|nr:LPXTG cell wall anchor domain-containing protein [Lawsonibacter sp.]